MATTNTSRALGFRPVRYRNGAAFNGQGVLVGFSSSQTSDGYVGDVVQFDSTNRAVAVTDVYAPGLPLMAPVITTVTTTAIRGVILGFVPQPEFSQSATANLGLRYRVASTARYGWIVDDTSVIFEVQESAQGYVSASNNNIGKTADISYAAGSTTTGLSGASLSSTGQTSSARPFKYLNYSQRVDNFGFVAADNPSNAKFDVMIANSDLAQGNVGA